MQEIGLCLCEALVTGVGVLSFLNAFHHRFRVSSNCLRIEVHSGCDVLCLLVIIDYLCSEVSVAE